MPIKTRAIFASLTLLALPACAGSFTGPVEVTRFVSEQPAQLGQGTIAITFPEPVESEFVRIAFAKAVTQELQALGYTVVAAQASAPQTAAIRTSRNQIEAEGSGRGPVSVGVGGGGGSFGSGVGGGIGINLGGGNTGPNIVTELSIRISDAGGNSLWEGGAQQRVSLKSDYADLDASAQALSAAMFKDFPGGNGETIEIDVDDLRDQ